MCGLSSEVCGRHSGCSLAVMKIRDGQFRFNRIYLLLVILAPLKKQAKGCIASRCDYHLQILFVFLDPAIPTSSFNFIQTYFCSFFIALRCTFEVHWHKVTHFCTSFHNMQLVFQGNVQSIAYGPTSIATLLCDNYSTSDNFNTWFPNKWVISSIVFDINICVTSLCVRGGLKRVI